MKKVKKVREYLDAARALKRQRGTSLTRELAGLLQFRKAAGKGPRLYGLYALYNEDPEYWGEWLDKAEMNQIQKTVNDPEIFYRLDDKFVFYDRCVEADLPVPPMLAVQSVDTEGKYEEISSAESLKRLLERWQIRELVFKRVRGSYGFGFFSIVWDGEAITDLASEHRYSTAEFYELIRAQESPYLVQKKLSPSKELSDVMPGGALGTVRVMTYRYLDGSLGVPYAFVKLPVSGQVNDNFKHGKSGNLLCGIHVDTGRLMKAYGVDDGCVSIVGHATHPETDAVLEGRQLSFWDEAVTLCKEAAKHFPEFRTVGWDVAVTDDALYILEGNRTYDPDGLQVTLRRGMRSEITALYKT